MKKPCFFLLQSIMLSAVFSLSYSISEISNQKHVILFIWDGLRPDSITYQDTPNLYRLKNQGVWFSDNHSTYPTLTMMNAASFATGDVAGKTGFYGNTLLDTEGFGVDAANNPIDFSIPVFTEDYHILLDIDHPERNHPLLVTPTLFSLAENAHLKTATIGKSGAAFIQNYQQRGGMNGINFDEKHVYPLEFAKQLQRNNYPLPLFSPNAYPGQLTLSGNNGDPTHFDKIATLNVVSGNALGLKADFIYPDNMTPDPVAGRESPYSNSNHYLMKTYLDIILPTEKPNLSVVWMRNPDSTEHNYGVGSPAYYAALHDQDELLGLMLKKLKELKLLDQTDIIIASDHAHSNVSGPITQFPLRTIRNGMMSLPNPNGYSVSGDFRPADLLTRAGFHAYDGQGCQYDPVLSGIREDGHSIYPISLDKEGKVCADEQRTERFYTTASYKLPKSIPEDAIIVAGNGGSTYFYVVNHDPKLVMRLVRYLQSRQEFGAVFSDDRYGKIPGTLSMSLVRILNAQQRNPDIIAGSSFDDTAKIANMNGIEFNSGGTSRGMHGSFSRTDVHNTLLAFGPDFKTEFIDTLPTGNIDVAPTIAYLLNLPLPDTHGRPLLEALKSGRSLKDYSVQQFHIRPDEPAIGLRYQLATDPNGDDIDPSKTHYTIDLQSKLLTIDGKDYPYFDTAKELRY